LHTRTIVRDGHQAFVGSQSLRELELGARREIGIIFREPKIVSRLSKLFQEDWDATGRPSETGAAEEVTPAAKVAKRVAKVVAKELPPLTPVLQGIVKDVDLNPQEIEATVRDAVKEAVKEAVRSAVEGIDTPGAD
jgi:hypothetical protein